MKNKKIILVSSFLAAGLLGFFAVKAMSKDKNNPVPCPGNPSKTYIPGEQYASDPCKKESPKLGTKIIVEDILTPFPAGTTESDWPLEQIPGREDLNF